ncbi:Sh3 domain-containing protein, partial [Thalictrum thalictroides]
VRIVAAQALTTMAIRSGEPFRLQIYEFLHALVQGGMQSQFSEIHLSNGEDQGASGTGLGSLIAPMLKVLDEMYRAQDDLIREIAKYLPLGPTSAKLIDIYQSNATPEKDPDELDQDLVNAWAANLGDDGLWGNNAPAMNRVNEFLAGAGTDAPDVEEENFTSRASVSYDDMWAKTLLETTEVEDDDARSSGTSSPESTGSVETSISSHFGGMSYPSLFSSRPTTYGASQSSERSGAAGSRFSNPGGSSSTFEGVGSPIREEPPSYEASVMQRFESFENPMAARGAPSFGSLDDEEPISSDNQQFGKALYDFTAGGDDEVIQFQCLTRDIEGNCV